MNVMVSAIVYRHMLTVKGDSVCRCVQTHANSEGGYVCEYKEPGVEGGEEDGWQCGVEGGEEGGWQCGVEGGEEGGWQCGVEGGEEGGWQCGVEGAA